LPPPSPLNQKKGKWLPVFSIGPNTEIFVNFGKYPFVLLEQNKAEGEEGEGREVDLERDQGWKEEEGEDAASTSFGGGRGMAYDTIMGGRRCGLPELSGSGRGGGGVGGVGLGSSGGGGGGGGGRGPAKGLGLGMSRRKMVKETEETAGDEENLGISFWKSSAYVLPFFFFGPSPRDFIFTGLGYTIFFFHGSACTIFFFAWLSLYDFFFCSRA
jgi:hypothetical protein